MDNSYSIEELIDKLEDTITGAVRVPFNKKGMVDIDKAMEILDNIRMNLPRDIKQAQNVVSDKNNIIGAAKKEAESIIRNAEQRRDELIENSSIIKDATRLANERVLKEQNYCAGLRSETMKFLNSMVSRIEELLKVDLGDLEKIRANINGQMSGNPSVKVVSGYKEPLSPPEIPGSPEKKPSGE